MYDGYQSPVLSIFDRNLKIVELRYAGFPPSKIAPMVGMRRGGVSHVLEKHIAAGGKPFPHLGGAVKGKAKGRDCQGQVFEMFTETREKPGGGKITVRSSDRDKAAAMADYMMGVVVDA